MKVRELFVRIGVKSDGDERLDELEDRFNDVKEAAGRLAKWLGAVTAATAGVSAIAGKAAINFQEYSEEVIRNANAMQLGTQRYQQFRFAFRQLNASTDDMMDAFSTVTDRAVDAVEGNKEYRREFERLGIAMDEIRNRDPGELFERYMQAAQETADRTDAVTAAVRLFGDDLGRRILPALTSSAESFEMLTRQATKAGLVFEEDALVAARELRMEYRTLRGQIKALWLELGRQALPHARRFIDRLRIMINEIQTSTGFIDLLVDSLDILAQNLEKVWDIGEMLGEALGLDGILETIRVSLRALGVIVGGITAVLTGSLMYAVYSLAALLGKSLLITIGIFLAKAIAIAAALTAVFFIAEDIYGYFMGYESLTGKILENFGEQLGLFDAISRTLKDWGPIFEFIIWLLGKIGYWLGTVIWEWLKQIFSLLGEVAEFILGLFNLITSVVANTVKIVWGLIMLLFASTDKEARKIRDRLFGYFKDMLKGVSMAFLNMIESIVSAVATVVDAVMVLIQDLAQAWDWFFGTELADKVANFRETLGKAIEIPLNIQDKKARKFKEDMNKAARSAARATGAAGAGPVSDRAVNRVAMGQTEQSRAFDRAVGGGIVTGARTMNVIVNQQTTVQGNPEQEAVDKAKDLSDKQTEKAAAELEGGQR